MDWHISKKKEIESNINTLEASIKEHFENIQKERNKILEVLDKGERFVTKISYKSIGMPIAYSVDGQKQFISLKSALGDDYTSKIKSPTKCLMPFACANIIGVKFPPYP